MNLISFLSVVLLVMHLQASIFAQILWTIIPPDKLKFDLRPNDTRIKPFIFRTKPLVSPATDLVGGAGRITWHLSGTNKTINRTMSLRDGQGTQGDVGGGQQRNTRILWVVNHSPKTELSGQVDVRLNIDGGGRRRSSRRGGGGRRHLSRGGGGGGEGGDGDRLNEAKFLEEAQ